MPKLFTRTKRKKSLGQSITEFALLLPLLIMMISGLIEFGFMLNYYLDIIDAAREAARFGADHDPIRLLDGTLVDQNPAFYIDVQTLAKEALDSGSDHRINWLPPYDNCADIPGDIVISAFAVLQGGTVATRFPVAAGENGVTMCGHQTSAFTTAEITGKLVAAAPNAGMVLVEVFYDYHMVLGLPWIKAFVPDPVTLHAYSVMPNANVEPTPTPP